MKAVNKVEGMINPSQYTSLGSIECAVKESWRKIPASWPLRNIIAANPLAGFEDLSFEQALEKAEAYFQQEDLPVKMLEVNRQSIKWLQVYFDEGQATLKMPLRGNGLLKSVRMLLLFDEEIIQKNQAKLLWLKNLPESPQEIIAACLFYLHIKPGDSSEFMSLMLTTLPGWSAYVQYRTTWADAADQKKPYTVTKAEYLAFRLLLTCLLWPEAETLLDWHEAAISHADSNAVMSTVLKSEMEYKEQLISKFSLKKPTKGRAADVQMVFCIDVRSEPFRRAIESQGAYETFGFAGFFGMPVSIENSVSHESHASCPVLLKPKHRVKFNPSCMSILCEKGNQRSQTINRLYQSVKYNFVSPLALVETMGLAAGLWMGIRSLFPHSAYRLKTKMAESNRQSVNFTPDIQSIPFHDQCQYAAGALKMMGLTQYFSPLIILCGHGAQTTNNAYASALDCGACAGRHGGSNAKILSKILNQPRVRQFLKSENINIPDYTLFLAAEHNTTTDHLEIFEQNIPPLYRGTMRVLKQDLEKSRQMNSQWRCQALGEIHDLKHATKHAETRSKNWAEVRPEWGLARNASFIVGPRALTKNIDLEGRSFLHSYDWTIDPEGEMLATILTAPMVVAQWINSQYFFSTLDNVAYGGGSKITKNITGKIGVMQGNASDLMHGLPLQSVYKTDKLAYHDCLRLLTVVHAPRERLDAIIRDQKVLKKLFANGWVMLTCIDPNTHEISDLNRDLTWSPRAKACC